MLLTLAEEAKNTDSWIDVVEMVIVLGFIGFIMYISFKD